MPSDLCHDASASSLGKRRPTIARYGRPEIFNTDQGSQFTSDDFTGTLKLQRLQRDEGRCAELRA